MADHGSKSTRRQYLIGKYLNNACSREELDELLREVENDRDGDALSEAFHAYWGHSDDAAAGKEATGEEQFDQMMEEIHRVERRPAALRRRWQIAAAILLLIGAAALWLLDRPRGQHEMIYAGSPAKGNDIRPGGNKAVLIMADGAVIGLDSVQTGMLTLQGSTRIVKTDSGQLAYDAAPEKLGKVFYNTVVTPRGGQYQIILPDGTKVWLNAGSSLKFPTAFHGKERRVVLGGEGYFEVAKDKDKPFKVEVNKMEVAVLGTAFNIMAYEDETTINTTLVEGSVSVSAGHRAVLLKQGQQARLNTSSGQMTVVKATADAAAWKDGLFRFNDTDLETIMRQIARWYNVEISYRGDIPNRTFTGTIPRTADLSHILKVLTLSNVHFQVTGGKIIVIP